MNKQTFLKNLKRKLSRLPKREIEEQLRFYEEMIDDRMEEGMTEEEAIAQIGSVDEIARQIAQDNAGEQERAKPQGSMKTWEIVLLAVGSPIWFSLLVAAFSVIFSLFVTLWSLVIAFWAIFAALAACAPSGIIGGIIFASLGYGYTGIAVIAAGLVCGGLAIFCFFGCHATVMGAVWLTKTTALSIRNLFRRKESV